MSVPNDVMKQNLAAMMGGGGQPGMPPGAPPAAAPIPQPPAPVPETPTEKAEASGAPKTEADKMTDNPVMYQIPWGENETRNLSPDQIRGTFERYEEMLDGVSSLGDAPKMFKQLMDHLPPGTDPNKVMQALLYSQTHNPQMGKQSNQQDGVPQGGANTPSSESISDQLRKWSEENASTPPPMYEEMVSSMMGMNSQMGQLMNMMQMLMGRAGGIADAARVSAQDSRKQMAMARREKVDANLQRVQNHLGWTKEDLNDFHTFAAERGFTDSEFLDIGLLARLAKDFQGNKNSPEMERMREIHKRRQAFTGAVNGSVPGEAMAPAQAPAPGMEALAEMFDGAKRQRGI